MNKLLKITAKTLCFILILLVTIILISFINHSVRLKFEAKKYPPIGKMVEVNGHNIHVYAEGEGDVTLVFMSGAGTSSPVLDFKPLYSIMSEEYRIAVVEKAGYGWSETANISRDIDTVLEETRKALELAGEKAPFVLFPHSMSGIEAIYWSQKYPDEVKAIVGLDPAVPEAYDNFPIPSDLSTSFTAFAARIGVTRLPSILDSTATMQSGKLSELDTEMYRAMFYRSTQTSNMNQT